MSFNGKICVITGANSGLGFAVSKEIARRGAHTILVCRNGESGERAVHEIIKEMPVASTDLMICDLASMHSIQSFMEEFKSRYSKLDLLYNNAAVMKRKRTLTEDGFEMMFQVNYLAAFILMHSFLELLKQGSSPQILNNGRPADDLRLDFEDLQFSKKYSMYNSFFRTKLCLLLATLEFSRRKLSHGITVTMADPGPFKSNLVRDVPWFGWIKNLTSAKVEDAADNILYAVTRNEREPKTGRLFEKRQEKLPTSYWQDREVGQHLWSITERLLEDNEIADQMVEEAGQLSLAG